MEKLILKNFIWKKFSQHQIPSGLAVIILKTYTPSRFHQFTNLQTFIVEFFTTMSQSVMMYFQRIVFVYTSLPSHCDFFRGLSLALRSHHQIPPSHWLTQINNAISPKLYRSYYLHRSRNSLSPVCRIFFALQA